MKDKRIRFSCLSRTREVDDIAKERILEVLEEKKEKLEWELALQRENLEADKSQAIQDYGIRMDLIGQWETSFKRIHDILMDLEAYNTDENKVVILETEKESIMEELKRKEIQLNNLHRKLNQLQMQGLKLELQIYNKENANELDSVKQEREEVKGRVGVLDMEKIVYENELEDNAVSISVAENNREFSSKNEAQRNNNFNSSDILEHCLNQDVSVDINIVENMKNRMNESFLQNCLNYCDGEEKLEQGRFENKKHAKSIKNILQDGHQILHLERKIQHYQEKRDLLAKKIDPMKADIVKLLLTVEENKMKIKLLLNEEDLRRGFLMKCAFLESDIVELVTILNKKREEATVMKRKLFVLQTNIVSSEASRCSNETPSSPVPKEVKSKLLREAAECKNTAKNAMTGLYETKIILSQQPAIYMGDDGTKTDSSKKDQKFLMQEQDEQEEQLCNKNKHIAADASNDASWFFAKTKRNIEKKQNTEDDEKLNHSKEKKRSFFGIQWRKKSRKKEKARQNKAKPC